MKTTSYFPTRYRKFSENSLKAVPKAPCLNSIPDIDSILSAEGDAVFDINLSQFVNTTQRRHADAISDDGLESQLQRNVSASSDGPEKKIKVPVYPAIHRVDPRLVSHSGKKARGVAITTKTPGQRKMGVQERQEYGSQDDLFEESEECFRQTFPVGDPLYTPAPLIVPVCSQAGRMKLRSVSEIAENYRSIFDFPYFNIVQSKVFDDVMYTDKPLVLCSPTGSGKTAVFEMAIVRLMTRPPSSINSSFKIVYMAPIKALCSERYNDWKKKLEPLGLKCMELTGDTDVDDFYRLHEVQVILTTPEKWDSMTRKWRDNAGMMQAICLFLIDEIHILNDPSRGSTVEAVVTRMKTMQAARARTSADSGLPPLRFIAVSATITNIDDVAEWLGNTRSRAVFYKMDDSVRPVRLRKVVLGYYYAENKQSEFQFDFTLSYKLAAVIKTYSENKPTLVFCSTRKSTQQSAEILSKDMKSSFVKSARHRQQLNNLSFHIKDAKLRDLVCKGIGYHHAGMDLQDRKNVEEAFASGELPVLVSTSTLAMGVNLPAHLVIIKSTMFYNLGVYQEYPDTQVLQMIGRAGRPQFDTSATAVIMTKNQTKMKYENLLNGTQLIESSLHKNLIEHLNAEIVLRTISDISVAMEWLKYTFLYIRVFKNPRHYGLPLGLTRDSIEKRLQDMCMKDLKQLNSLDLISMDEENLDVKPQESGKLMARYCISFKTMQLFSEVKGAETVAEMVALVSRCEEFMDIQLRNNEKRTLNTLNRDKNRITIRYPMQGKIKTTDMKVSCLIQTAFGCLMLQDFALQQDTSRIFRAGIRVTRCLVELLWQKKDFKALLSAVQLCRCFKAKLWEDSKFVSKQLEGIGPALSNALVNAGITTFEKIEELNPREIELIVNRHPPFGNQLRESASSLPKYEIVIEQMTRYAVNTSEIVITIQLSNRESLRDKASTSHTCTLLIGDQDNKIVFKQRLMDAQLLKEGWWTKKLDIKLAAKGPDLFVHYISQEWVGLDVECTFSPNYLGGRRITNSSTSVSPKNKNFTNTPVPVTDSKNIIVPCNHQCHNKQACAHDCCKTGVSVRKRQQRSANRNSMAHDKDKSCGRVVLNHVNEIHARIATMPQNPGQFKRPRLEFKTNSGGNSPVADLSKFSYTPGKQAVYDTAYEDNSDWQLELDTDQADDMEFETEQEAEIQSRRVSDWMELEMFQKHREQCCTEDQEQSYQEDDQHSLPDLLFNSPGATTEEQPEELWNGQQQDYGFREDDFAHETEYGYFYVHGDDMNKPPADWDDKVTQEAAVLHERLTQRKTPVKEKKENACAKRKPLFQSKNANRRSVADNFMYDQTNDTVNDEGDIGFELIENYESDEDQAGSRWNDFMASQSSEGTDYLNQPFPAKLERGTGLNQSFQEVGKQVNLGGGPKLDQHQRKGVVKPTSYLRFNNIESQNWAHTRVSLKPSFLTKHENGVQREAQNIGGDFGSALPCSFARKDNKENFHLRADKRVPKKSASEVKSNYWEDTVIKRPPQSNLAKTLRDKLEAKADGEKQTHKFGQVLAWVSSSQNKTPEGKSESDWEDWSVDTDLLMAADQTVISTSENNCRPSTLDVSHSRNFEEEKQSKAMASEEGTKQKQMKFSSFFSREQPQDKLDSIGNIFDGIF